jgi:allantoicase
LIDTCHFKGNYPDSCLLEGCNITRKEENKLLSNEAKWTTILPQVKLSADKEHYFENEITAKGPFTHVRLSIFPDGGISRMRLWGKIINM